MVFLAEKYLGFDKYTEISRIIKRVRKTERVMPEIGDLIVPEGFEIDVFADIKNLGFPRVLAFDENGVLFTSLTLSGKIVALPDKDNNLKMDGAVVVMENLKKPHGIKFYNGYLFIAETNRVVRYDYDPETMNLTNPVELFRLKEGGINDTKTIDIFNGNLYTSVGSSCDACLEKDKFRATMLVSGIQKGEPKIFASGLRNTAFFTFDNKGNIWGNDMGRDLLGDNLPPDELNIIKENANYGWPYCYGNRIRDMKFRSLEALDRCKDTRESLFDYTANSFPSGLKFIESEAFPEDLQGDLLVALHGSGNVSRTVGYKIVKLKIKDKEVVDIDDFVYGWLKEDGKISGRPVDLVFDREGRLFISDDKAGLIYILRRI